MQPHSPKERAEGLGAASEQPADDPGEDVAAARHAQARGTPVIGPGLAVRRDDMARDALDEDERAIELRGFEAAFRRIALDLIFAAIEQRRELAGVGKEDGPACPLGLDWLELVEERRVEGERRFGVEQCFGDSAAGMIPGPATTASTAPACSETSPTASAASPPSSISVKATTMASGMATPI